MVTDIMLTDSRVLAIPVQDSHDPMTDLRFQDVIHYGKSPEIPDNNDYTKMRQSVYHMLVRAQGLLPRGRRLCLYEGFRSLELQDFLFKQRYAKLQQSHPQWGHEALFHETCLLISPVVNLDGTENLPPHVTGGAVDVYLVDDEGCPVDMGILVENWMDDSDGSISRTNSAYISQEAHLNRQVMSSALSAVGFQNYFAEYWHWSYGDRYWAYLGNHGHAIFGDPGKL